MGAHDEQGRASGSRHGNPAKSGVVAVDGSGKRAKRRRRRKLDTAGTEAAGRVRQSEHDVAAGPAVMPDRPRGEPGRTTTKEPKPAHRQVRAARPDVGVAAKPGGFPGPVHSGLVPPDPVRAARLRGVRSPVHGAVPKLREPSRPPEPAHSAPEGDLERGLPPAGETPRHAGQHRGAGFPPRHGPQLYAALDLGTNNCRLLIVEARDTGFRVVDAFSRIVRLGEGLARTGRLGDEAMTRAIEALAVCRQKLEYYRVPRARLIATEACRIAGNGAEFIERVWRQAGLRLEIVDRQTEARLAVAGCATLVDDDAAGAVIFDIGGGSSELAWLDLRQARRSLEAPTDRAHALSLSRHIRAWTSLPIGVVTLSERHGGVDVTPPLFARMVDEVSDMLADFAHDADLDRLVTSGEVHLLGTSGTVTTLAGVFLGLRRYDRRRVDGIWLSAFELDDMLARMSAMSYAERIANPCIGTDRADLVLAGCAILDAIRRRWPCRRLRVADRGLREGILTELIAEDRARPRGRHADRKDRS